MKEITGNIFDQHDADAICVTTNGVVKANGELVMGAGIAKEFAKRYPELARNLGFQISREDIPTSFQIDDGLEGTHVHPYYTWDIEGAELEGYLDLLAAERGRRYLTPEEKRHFDQRAIPQPVVVSFPTKNHFRDLAILGLIERSAKELVLLTDMWGWKKIVLPRPGCGLGQLDWETVKAVIEPILDDRFYVIVPKKGA